MKPWHPLRSIVLFTAIIVTSAPNEARTADGPSVGRNALYDTAAEGKEQITAALKTAQAEHKRVILKFGANWCGWCHKLSGLLKTNAELAQLVKDNYVLVLIDVDKKHNTDTVEKYGNPTQHGLPVLADLAPLHWPCGKLPGFLGRGPNRWCFSSMKFTSDRNGRVEIEDGDG